MSYSLPDGIFDFPEHSEETSKAQWEKTMSMAMWGALQSEQIGKVTRMRKRLLDLGEAIQSFFGPKDWIDQPRQQLKSALGSSIKLRDALSSFRTSAALITRGDDQAEFQQVCEMLESDIMALLGEKENQWAEALDSLGYNDD